MTQDRKENITVCSAVAMLVFGCVLTTIAFFIEPMGVIHDSVLWVLGQCFIYAGGALGIANYARSAAKHEVDERFSEFERHHRHHRAPVPDDISDEIDGITSYEKPIDNGED
jgi:hypothetical protein